MTYPRIDYIPATYMNSYEFEHVRKIFEAIHIWEHIWHLHENSHFCYILKYLFHIYVYVFYIYELCIYIFI